MHYRAMLDRDIDDVVTIESTVTEFPWSRAQFQDSLLASHDCFVLINNNKLCGFIIFSRVLDETTLLDIAVLTDVQRQGHGRYLLERGLKQQLDIGVKKCFLEVRVSNLKAQTLYRSMGFALVGERKNYYPANVGSEDALVMCRDLSTGSLAVA